MKQHIKLYEEFIQSDEELLLEKSFYDFKDLSDVVNVEKYLRDLEHHKKFEELYVGDYKAAKKIKTDIKFQDWNEEDKEEFRKWLSNEVYSTFDYVQGIIDDQIDNDGRITIYRGVQVVKNWEDYLAKEGKHLGIYWTYSEDSPEAWMADTSNSNRTESYVIQSSVLQHYVDWTKTFKLNMDINMGDMEKEIRLFKNTPIKIEGLWNEAKRIDISKIKDKTFYA